MNQSFPSRQRYNLFSEHQLGKALYSHEANQFFYLQKKFQKIRTKIESVGTCLKSHLSPKGTIVLQGLNEILSVVVKTISAFHLTMNS